jgi:hypothetical protein
MPTYPGKIIRMERTPKLLQLTVAGGVGGCEPDEERDNEGMAETTAAMPTVTVPTTLRPWMARDQAALGKAH